MGNLATKVFTANGTFTPPAGVNTINVITQRNVKFPSETNQNMNMPCFVDSLGNAFTWGQNAQGQGINSAAVPQSSPVACVGGLTNLRKLEPMAQNQRVAFYLDGAGKLWAAGSANGNTAGIMGTGVSTGLFSSPVAVLGGKTWIDFAVAGQDGNSNQAAFGLTLDGSLFSWGGGQTNNKGNLGTGNTAATGASSPVAVLGGLKFQYPLTDPMPDQTIIQIAQGGAAYAWGANSFGQLGVGDVVARSSPVAVLGGLTFSKICIFGTTNYVIGLSTAGAIYGWGNNGNGQAGVGDRTPRSSPVACVGVAGKTFTNIIAGGNGSAFALDTTGAVWAWGSNDNGQLGVGDVNPRSSPVQVLGGLTVSKMWFAYDTNNTTQGMLFLLTTAGALYACGRNTHGDLGVGDVNARSSPVAVLGGLTFQALCILGGSDSSPGPNGFIGITPSGVLYGWGFNPDGGLGVGDTTPRSSPVAVLGGLLAGMKPFIRTTQLTVTPGTSLSVTFQGQSNAIIGTTVVDVGPIDSVTIQYEQ